MMRIAARPLTANLSERFQEPFSITVHQMTAQDIKVAVIRQNLEEIILRAVPLIDNLFHRVFMMAKPKPHRPLVSLSTGIAVHIQLQHVSFIETL